MIETARLILRIPEPRDLDALHAMWSDADAMRNLGPAKGRQGSEATLNRHLGYRASDGLGFWVAERRDDRTLAGFCGLKPGAPNTPIAGELEIGWMFVRSVWGQGYAREAAEASLTWGWRHRRESRIVAITAIVNEPSRRLMGRLGMTAFAEFMHPVFDPADRLAPTVAYSIGRP